MKRENNPIEIIKILTLKELDVFLLHLYYCNNSSKNFMDALTNNFKYKEKMNTKEFITFFFFMIINGAITGYFIPFLVNVGLTSTNETKDNEEERKTIEYFKKACNETTMIADFDNLVNEYKNKY